MGKEWFLKAANFGNGRAMGVLAEVLEKDDHAGDTAVNCWFRKAACRGGCDAMCDYGKRLALGRGVAIDAAGARFWNQRAAERGHVCGMVRLADDLRDSASPVLQREAFRWSRCAAEWGSLNGMFLLAICLAGGQAGSHDLAEAEIWLRKAAGGGQATAMVSLGDLLAGGDPVQAMSWWRKAATRGIELAMFRLGCGLRDGLGGPVDPVEAAVWLRKAASLGRRDAESAWRCLSEL